jgi:diacylglycerol kinase (ATP)
LNHKIPMKIAIIANPVSGGGRAYRSIQSYVRQWPHPDWDVEILATRAPDHAGQLARDLIHRPPDVLAVCGGDGTINEIATSLPQPPFPVALLPAGTANVLARELGIPLNPVKALRIAMKGATRRIDLGCIGPGSKRRFLFVGGIGFDAYCVSIVRPGLKKKLGMAAYAFTILECLKSYAFPEFDVIVNDRTFKATSCLACNAKRYGGGLLFCPDAEMNDGLLDFLVLEGKRRVGLARFLFQAWLGRPEKGDWIHRLRSSSAQIEGPDRVLIQADGELAGTLPVNITLANSAFPLVIP